MAKYVIVYFEVNIFKTIKKKVVVNKNWWYFPTGISARILFSKTDYYSRQCVESLIKKIPGFCKLWQQYKGLNLLGKFSCSSEWKCILHRGKNWKNDYYSLFYRSILPFLFLWCNAPVKQQSRGSNVHRTRDIFTLLRGYTWCKHRVLKPGWNGTRSEKEDWADEKRSRNVKKKAYWNKWTQLNR